MRFYRQSIHERPAKGLAVNTLCIPHDTPVACELRLFGNDTLPDVTDINNDQDIYIISMPLARNNARLESNGRVLHDGDVRPGMMRISHEHHTSPVHAVLRRADGSMERAC